MRERGGFWQTVDLDGLYSSSPSYCIYTPMGTVLEWQIGHDRSSYLTSTYYAAIILKLTEQRPLLILQGSSELVSCPLLHGPLLLTTQ